MTTQFERLMRAADAAAAKVRRHSPLTLFARPGRAWLSVWIADQPDPKPSREEAARRLIALALARK